MLNYLGGHPVYSHIFGVCFCVLVTLIFFPTLKKLKKRIHYGTIQENSETYDSAECKLGSAVKSF